MYGSGPGSGLRLHDRALRVLLVLCAEWPRQAAGVPCEHRTDALVGRQAGQARDGGELWVAVRRPSSFSTFTEADFTGRFFKREYYISMTQFEELHTIQRSILRSLLFKQGVRFSELNTENIPSDQFSFHMKRLSDLGLIKKQDDGEYQLTVQGKEYANRLDTDGATVKIERQAKVAVLVVPVRMQGDVKQFLVQQRLKQPYYGFHGFVTGKIKWGETVDEAAKRELKEETGLDGSLTLMGVKHKMDYSPDDGSLLEDKFFFAFKAENLKGKLAESFEGGQNTWRTHEEIKNLPDQFDGVEESLKMIEQTDLVFLEKKYVVKRY